MRSFNTDHVVNPYQTFANIFSMLLRSPSLHLIFDWLTGAPDSHLSGEPLKLNYGRWILCSYGRFGHVLYQKFLEHDIDITILEPNEDVYESFKQDNIDQAEDMVIGTGIDEKSLNRADVKNAVGIIAGGDDDSNNLSTIMTARQMNPDIFVVARQNLRHNSELFDKSNADLVMQPREITARMIRALIINPLLKDYLDIANKQDEQWSNIVISRLSAVIGDCKPHIWSTEINSTDAPAIVKGIELGRTVTLSRLLQDPVSRDYNLKSVALLHERNGKYEIMPDDATVLDTGDHILFCGMYEAMNSMNWILHVMSTLNYVMSYEDEPESYFWRKIKQRYKGHERRHSQR